MKATRIAAAALASLCWAGRASAVEVSLEENKINRGSVGFVDMNQIFKLFPETQREKQGFEEAVRQAEEQINLRRAEILGLRNEISRLKAERDLAAKSVNAPLVNLSPAVKPSSSIPPAPGANIVPNIPGMPESTVVPSATVSASTSPAKSNVPPVPPTSVSVSTGAATSAVSAHLVELDRDIEQKSKILDSREADFKTFESQTEKSLLDLESRKSEVLLGHIYTVIQDVAKDEAVSVVVDKSRILYGSDAVDLTDRVIQKLKGENQ